MRTVYRLWMHGCVLVATVCTLLVTCSAPAAAQDVTIERGYIWMYPPNLFGVSLAGNRGFAFQGLSTTLRDSFIQGLVPPDVFGPSVCGYAWDAHGCESGTVVDIGARWVGSRLTGHAAVDGELRQHVGDVDVLSMELTGSITLPSRDECSVLDGGCGTVIAPFVLSGIFSMNGEDRRLSGTGTATVYLFRSMDAGSWLIPRVDYDFEPALAPPWTPRCPYGDVPVGPMYCDTYATVTDETIMVSGPGDFWGSYDGGHYILRAMSGDGEIQARVRTQSSIDPLAKAGVMIRQASYPWSPHVLLDLKPDGGIEFMVRRGVMSGGFPGEDIEYLAGAVAPAREPRLKLAKKGDLFTAWTSADGVTWIEVGSVTVSMSSQGLAGLAVSSHSLEWNTAMFDHVAQYPAPNLLLNGDFEYAPGALRPWISDYPYRQTPAIAESFQPRSGGHNGACWTPEYLDCGMYQDVRAPAGTGTYIFRIYAAADRPGGLVGVNVNGYTVAWRDVVPGAFGDYAVYTMPFAAQAGDLIRVWMYSPASPGTSSSTTPA